MAPFLSRQGIQQLSIQGDLEAYLPILVLMGVAFFLSFFLLGLSFLRRPHRPDVAKLSPYECGFSPFSEARLKFDVRFYLVALLFIIFDLEVGFLFPWAVTLKEIGPFGFFSMIAFLGVLGVGFFYEWRRGALEWE